MLASIKVMLSVLLFSTILMAWFYKEMKGTKEYTKALREAKLMMIDEGKHPFYWGTFVVSGE